jgi:hypothetical protein
MRSCFVHHEYCQDSDRAEYAEVDDWGKDKEETERHDPCPVHHSSA